jgi:hypothetical protein
MVGHVAAHLRAAHTAWLAVTSVFSAFTRSSAAAKITTARIVEQDLLAWACVLCLGALVSKPISPTNTANLARRCCTVTANDPDGRLLGSIFFGDGQPPELPRSETTPAPNPFSLDDLVKLQGKYARPVWPDRVAPGGLPQMCYATYSHCPKRRMYSVLTSCVSTQ